MRTFSSTLKTVQARTRRLRQQPYVYLYRASLFLLRSKHVRRLIKWYADRLLAQTRRYVDAQPTLSIDAIMTHPAFVTHHFTQLYALCRRLQPSTVVETGVGLGTSSLFILQALEDNGKGRLYSIDQPFAAYRSDAGITIDESAYTAYTDEPGAMVPDALRHRWDLLLGKSDEHLPTLCDKLGSLDFFFHDSEHTYHNMMWEYATVWPHLRHHGVLASHDVEWNTAFQDFAAAQRRSTHISRNVGLIVQ
jgi:predicted O-methyltransferase YrrM